MIVLESVPLWLFNNRGCGIGVDNNFVTVELGAESGAILVSHFSLIVLDHVISLVLHAINELLSVRRVTNALEELDSFLSFKLLKLAILFDKVLLIHR